MSNEYFTDACDAFCFLGKHNMVKTKSEKEDKNSLGWASHFLNCLDIEYVKVNPVTKEIDVNNVLNTQDEIWLEFGIWDEKENIACHDLDLDCGGSTFDEAIVNLANLVKKYYDDDGNKIE